MLYKRKATEVFALRKARVVKITGRGMLIKSLDVSKELPSSASVDDESIVLSSPDDVSSSWNDAARAAFGGAENKEVKTV